ncbi:MAG TPA: MoaD/ThiS family protein, partial [Pyrinomonadaceae bacterium]|nr:MoaD/ThiS family protein [Pyrinomonadaceae bacterium]
MTTSADEKPETGEGAGVVRVRLLLFGAAREAAGLDETDFDVRRPATAESAFEEIARAYPGLARFGRSLLVAVNQEYARDLEVGLKDGDELALFPPVSGGHSNEDDDARDFFELTTGPIDVGAVARRVVPRRCG